MSPKKLQVSQETNNNSGTESNNNSGKRMTIEKMKIKLGAIFGDRNEPIFTSLNNLENYPEFENEIEELLGRYSYIDEKNYQGAVNLMLTNLKRLLEKYEEEKRKIESDKKTRKRAIAPAEISDETDLPLFTSIMEKFSEVISVEDNKNGWKILEDRIEGITLKGQITKQDMDDHFEDLLGGLEDIISEQKIELKRLIEEFKENSDLYKSLGVIDLVGINGELDKDTDKILEQEIGPYEVNFGLVEGKKDIYSFNTKREALLAIYQIKLHLENAEPFDPFFWLRWPSFKEAIIYGAILAGGGVAGNIILKIYFEDHLRKINEGINADDLKELIGEFKKLKDFVSKYNTDESNRIGKIIKNLESIKIEHAKPGELIKALSTAYGEIARFRSIPGYLASRLWKINSEIGGKLSWNPLTIFGLIKPSRNPLTGFGYFSPIINIFSASINKGPDGWGWLTQKDVVNDTENRIRRFLESNKRIGETLEEGERVLGELKDDSGKIMSPERVFNEEIAKLYFDDNGKLRPFRDVSGDIYNVFRKYGISVPLNEEDFRRFIIGEEKVSTDGSRVSTNGIEFNEVMKEKFGQAENVIKMHPAIPDKAEKTMLFQLEFLKYSSDMSNGGDFDKKVISLIGPYIDVNDFNDITRLQIKPEEFIDEKQLLSLKNQAINLYNTSSDAINGSLKTYLSYTTEGHRGLFAYNIALILNGEKSISTLDLTTARELSKIENINSRNFPLNTLITTIKSNLENFSEKVNNHRLIVSGLDVLKRMEMEINLKDGIPSNLLKEMKDKLLSGDFSKPSKANGNMDGIFNRNSPENLGEDIKNWLEGNDSRVYTLSNGSLPSDGEIKGTGGIRDMGDISKIYLKRNLSSIDSNDVIALGGIFDGTGNRALLEFSEKPWYSSIGRILNVLRRGLT